MRLGSNGDILALKLSMVTTEPIASAILSVYGEVWKVIEKEVGGEKLVQDSAPRANRANITSNDQPLPPKLSFQPSPETQ